MLVKKILSRRGQAMVLYALLIPLLFLFVGVGIDLGWYFINVSRLQNAADAAALAGAHELTENISGYSGSSIKLTDKYPDDDSVQNLDSYSGDIEARKYAIKNLASNDEGSIVNGWTSGVVNPDYKLKKDADGNLYYVVQLMENVKHLFLRGSMFDGMNAPVTAVAMISKATDPDPPHGPSLLEAVAEHEKTKVVGNWEVQDYYRKHQDEYKEKFGRDFYDEKWNHFQDKTNSYTSGAFNRTETITVKQEGGSGKTTSANGSKYYDADKLDSINIDFKQDIEFKEAISNDWDLGYTLPDGMNIKSYINNSGDTNSVRNSLRIHSSININDAWVDRNKDDGAADILWTRIESEPIISDLGINKIMTQLNTVRQIIFNVNTSNTATETKQDDEGNVTTYYTQRPMFIFYTGPETNEPDNPDSVRKSQPVVFNLNADFNGILYAPNSPVIINGNGHILTGFVIAKEYLRLKNENDYFAEGYVKLTTNDNYTIFVKQEYYINGTEFEKLDGHYVRTIDSNGNISLTERRYTLNSYNDTESYNAAFRAYSHLTDAELVNVTLPTTTHNVEGRSFTVAVADLSDEQKDGYVEVYANGQKKYIYKGFLPYIQITRNNMSPYVSVYDLKDIQTDLEIEPGRNADAVIDMPDGTNDKYIDRNLLEKFYNKNYRYDNGSKMVNLTTDDMGNTFFDVKKPTVIETYIPVKEGGAIKSDTVFFIRIVPNGSVEANAIIIDQKGNLQTAELASNATRPTNANEQPRDTKRNTTITFTMKKDKDDPNSEEITVSREYRMDGYEIVYKAKEAFNLSSESRYSYFGIEDLKRENYKYLNVDELNDNPAGKSQVQDMFFTTTRAAWID